MDPKLSSCLSFTRQSTVIRCIARDFLVTCQPDLAKCKHCRSFVWGMPKFPLFGKNSRETPKNPVGISKICCCSVTSTSNFLRNVLKNSFVVPLFFIASRLLHRRRQPILQACRLQNFVYKGTTCQLSCIPTLLVCMPNMQKSPQAKS